MLASGQRLSKKNIRGYNYVELIDFQIEEFGYIKAK